MVKGKPRVENINFPTLMPSSWLKFMCSIGGETILGGHSIDNQPAWKSMLRKFWEMFNKSMPGINMNGVEPELAYPSPFTGMKVEEKPSGPF